VTVVVIGLNHRTAALPTLEVMTVGGERAPKALADLVRRDHISEAVVLSTCNRTEVYVYAEKFHGAYQDVREFLTDWSGLAVDEFADALYTLYDHDAVGHLFRVVSGLDSAVLGEHEVQRQVKDAWELARVEGTAGPTLNAVFRQALEVGKRARTETSIGRGTASVSHAAVAMAGEQLGTLAGRHVLVLGAGEVGEGMAQALAAASPGELVFVNRNLGRAEALAARVGGRAVGLEHLMDQLLEADVLLTSTGATALLVEAATLAEVMRQRRGRPLLIVDVAMPRDIEPAAGMLAGVTLLDMDDLRRFADVARRDRQAEVERVDEIIADEVERYLSARAVREVAPVITSLRTEVEAIRQAELARVMARHPELDPAAVEALTRSIVNKLLHQPTTRLTQAAGTPRGARLAEALRDLFDL
jgi:glutamyl-tRNA reductase